MVFIDACGVNVNFPFEPYDCQQVYIKKVIECLKHVRTVVHVVIVKMSTRASSNGIDIEVSRNGIGI